MRIGILIYPDADLLDCGGPYEVFLTANRLAERDGASAPFEVVTVGTRPGPLTSYGGLGLVAQTTVSDVGHLDLVVIPGTIALDVALGDPEIRAAVASVIADTPVVTSVCTGAFLLADHGVLTDRPWTTHWEDVDLLAEKLGAEGARRDVRWVDSGPIVTSAGLSSGIAMALHLVARFAGDALATSTARQIEYDWEPSGHR
jgi:transcriptional regulator GlxA family with amidase domain